MWRTRWKRARWWLLGLLVAAGLLVLVIGGYGFGWEWTGLGTSPKSNTTLPAKSVWDWLQLFIIPAALAGIALWFNWQQSKVEREIGEQHRKADLEVADQRRKADLEIAADQQRENALQVYLDRMADLLLDKQLRASQEGESLRQVARARTLTILRQLDTVRKTALFRFLYEAELVGSDHNIIDLSGADLSEADLRHANLSYIKLSGSNLSGADLSGADLRYAKLSRANLYKALLGMSRRTNAMYWSDLSGADLHGAELTLAKLGGSNLSGSNLSGAGLNGAELFEADLSEANLSGARLERADLSYAKMSGADLSGAYLYMAKIDAEQLEVVKSLEDATLPDGSKYHANPPTAGSAGEPPTP